MNINQTCPLILKDLYAYDVRSCYPTILSKQFYDFGDVDLENKQERSEFIGKKQIGNENLSTFLINSAENLVRFYLSENEVSEDDIILTQRDGFILKRTIDNDNEFIHMELRELIELMIVSQDRKKYISVSGGEVSVKGMPHLFDSILRIYQLFGNLNFYNKKILYQQLQNIKDTVLFCDNKDIFLIPREERTFAVITFDGILETKDPDMISITKINKLQYFENYFKPFIDSIFLETY